MKKLLIIDNYDSFTWNLYQYFRELGVEVIVRRHDSLNVTDIEQITPAFLVISPGPGTPNQSGISLEAIRYFAGKIPILGVCLGHQAIAQVFGANIVRAREVMHGKVSIIHHDKQGIFTGLPQKLEVVRYNSLIIKVESMPSCLDITAWSFNNKKKDEIMAIRHRYLPLEGVQFHPESIRSEKGHQLLANFLLNY